jgi:exoribonuclease-2
LPEAIGAKMDTPPLRPDKTSLEHKAVEQAAGRRGTLAAAALRARGRARRARSLFPAPFRLPAVSRRGSHSRTVPAVAAPADLPEARASAFSIDDAETTEIDDAFSVRRPRRRRARGRHPHRGAPRSSSIARMRSRPSRASDCPRSTFPGGKITMLPEEVLADATLAEGRSVPAASLYLRLDPETLEVSARSRASSACASTPTCGLGELDGRLDAAAIAAGRVEGPHGEDLLTLWRLASRLKALRGAADDKADRPDYTIRVVDGRVSIERRARGTPVDTVVAELMIRVNSTWGKLLADRGMPGIYRNQKGGKTRMDVEPGAHEWLGVSHYAWSSSPLRRFTDLANQRQLASLLRHEEPAYSRDELAQAARDFETAYEAYAEHQRLLERYWTLRYLVQEGIVESGATVIRDELVRIDALPLVCRTLGLPAGVVPGEQVRVHFGEVDPWEVHVSCRYAGK